MPEQPAPRPARQRVIDRLIDDGLRAVTRGEPVDLRDSVLAQLDERAEATTSRWPLLPSWAMGFAAGAAVVTVAVAASVTWWTWSHGAGAGAGGGGGTGVGAGNASASARTATGASVATPLVAGAFVSGQVLAAPTVAHTVRTAMAAILGSSSTGALAVDASSRRARTSGFFASVDMVVDLDDTPGPHFPGAPVAEFGGPLPLMPRPAPIVIPPIVTAPSMSEVAAPVSTLSTASDRDSSGPEKSGGFRQ